MVDPADDRRRRIPRTDALMGLPVFAAAARRLSPTAVKAAITSAQAAARAGDIDPHDVAARAADLLPVAATSLRPVINATGVVVHTNLGRAPLSAAAIEALTVASSYVDVEWDPVTGSRAARGRHTMAALRAAVPAAEAVHVVNNGAGALVLAATALAAGREILCSRGELVEIGDGFRLPDLVVSTGARLREVGTTNRTGIEDYRAAVGPQTGMILKVHPSNFVVRGFTSAVPVAELATLGPPVVADIGSGLLAPDPVLADEPDAATSLRAGAALVIASGDKLLGGPQAGLILGRSDLVERIRRHPLARGVRADKLTLAALEATLAGPRPPVWVALHADLDELRRRVDDLAAAVGTGAVVAHDGVVGGGGAPGQTLPGWALALPSQAAERLRTGEPCVATRLVDGRCLLDLRAVPAELDGAVVAAVKAALG
jgi:L-seryl-tRNA(Ser) seleniumtransferase